MLKHFPGHGSVGSDSHRGLPVQRRSLAALRRTDLVPFRAGIEAGVPAVMVGHLDVRRLDPGVPSSLSRRVVTGLLRRDLGFQGLVVSDSLAMAAVAQSRRPRRAAVASLRAGADVVLMPPDPAAARAEIVAAVRAGRLSRRRLEQAAARQVALLLHRRQLRPARPVAAAAASAALSRAALTSVAGPCRGRLVGRSLKLLGDPAAVEAFRAAVAGSGLRLGRGTRIGFVGRVPRRLRRPDVLVATDVPYVLGATRARVRLATYGITPGAMGALRDVLLGRRRAVGRLPVTVPGVRRGCLRH
ncbi:MAG: glycoside hydrolase family 3 N-terminal domain-containing protein [Nocardioides sp.]